jgi:hypothetical protein
MNTLIKILGTAVTIIIVVGAGFGIYNWINQPEPQTSSISTTLEDRCVFVKKTLGVLVYKYYLWHTTTIADRGTGITHQKVEGNYQ